MAAPMCALDNADENSCPPFTAMAGIRCKDSSNSQFQRHEGNRGASTKAVPCIPDGLRADDLGFRTHKGRSTLKSTCLLRC